MPSEKELTMFQKATIYDLLKILKRNQPEGKTYSFEEIEGGHPGEGPSAVQPGRHVRSRLAAPARGRRVRVLRRRVRRCRAPGRPGKLRGFARLLSRPPRVPGLHVAGGSAHARRTRGLAQKTGIPSRVSPREKHCAVAKHGATSVEAQLPRREARRYISGGAASPVISSSGSDRRTSFRRRVRSSSCCP